MPKRLAEEGTKINVANKFFHICFFPLTFSSFSSCMKVTFRVFTLVFSLFFFTHTVAGFHFAVEKESAGRFDNTPSKVVEKKDGGSCLVLGSLKVKKSVSSSFQVHSRSEKLLRVFHLERQLTLNVAQTADIFVIKPFLTASFTNAP